MPSCCRCNASGKCISCKCVKEGSRCVDCLPGRLGNCSNPPRSHSIQSPNEETSVRMAVGSIQLSDLPTNNVEEPSSTDDESTCPLPLPEPFDLPQYDPAEAPNFVWGSLKGEQFCRKIDDCYDEMVTWKRNIFKVPSGKQGQAFVRELARLFSSFAEANSMERIALKAAMVLPPLILQKPSSQSKAKDHAHCIERRMKLWLEGELDKLLEEVRAIQSRLPVTRTDAKNQQALHIC